MPPTVTGVAVPKTIEELADGLWWKFRHYNPRLAEDPRAVATWFYRRGYKDSLVDQGRFSGLHEDIRRLADLLETERVEHEAIRTTLGEDDFR